MSGSPQESEHDHYIVQKIKMILDQKILVVGLLFLLLPFILWAAWLAWISNENNVEDWLPQSKTETQELNKFIEKFGGDEILMISWDGCTLDDPRIQKYRNLLLKDTDTPLGIMPYYDECLTGPGMLELYLDDPLYLSQADAKKKMQGWVLSKDGKTTCLIAKISSTLVAECRTEAVDYAYQVASNIDGLSPDNIYLAGSSMQSVAFDKVSQSNLLELNLASYGISLVILFFCLKHIRAASIIFLTALFNEVMSMSLVYLHGENMDSVLLLSANLTFVLSISVGIHLFNYYRETIETHSQEIAPAWACFVALKPTALATMTTTLGLLSLSISELRPISRFGYYTAISIMISTVITLLFIGVHFSIWPLKNKVKEDKPNNDSGYFYWTLILNRTSWFVVVGSMVVLISGSIGISYLKTSVGLTQMINKDHRVIHDYLTLEETIGPLSAIEIILQMEPVKDDSREETKKLLSQYRTLSAVHESLANLDESYSVVSTQTFAPKAPPQKSGFRQKLIEVAFRRKLFANQDQLGGLGYLKGDDQSNSWRVTVRCPSTENLNYDQIIKRIEKQVEQTLEQPTQAEVSKVTITGGVPVVYQVQQQMLKDLINSFFLAFALVAITLMIIFRNFFSGLICMIPNLLPCAIAFGVMGYMNWPVELGTILTVCAALGIAVDDSMHFITWYRSSVVAGKSVFEAVRYAFCRCAAAMLQTTLICSLGLIVFYMSPFLPISKFGLCMFALLMLALIADLVVLPAIILSPLGIFFIPTQKKSAVEQKELTSLSSVSDGTP